MIKKFLYILMALFAYSYFVSVDDHNYFVSKIKKIYDSYINNMEIEVQVIGWDSKESSPSLSNQPKRSRAKW